MTNHLDTETIYALLDGRLDAAGERNAESHLLRCDACRAVREECALTLGSLRWYATSTPPAPRGYWDGFWLRFADRVREAPVRSVSARTRRIRRRSWMAPALAAAAVVTLLVGTWWVRGPQEPGETDPPRRTVAARSVVAETGWESDLEFFERATVAVGGVDPLSKGIVLASMAESR